MRDLNDRVARPEEASDLFCLGVAHSRECVSAIRERSLDKKHCPAYGTGLGNSQCVWAVDNCCCWMLHDTSQKPRFARVCVDYVEVLLPVSQPLSDERPVCPHEGAVRGRHRLDWRGLGTHPGQERVLDVRKSDVLLDGGCDSRPVRLREVQRPEWSSRTPVGWLKFRARTHGFAAR